jgi:Fe(3+) dicitrate transport protein
MSIKVKKQSELSFAVCALIVSGTVMVARPADAGQAEAAVAVSAAGLADAPQTIVVIGQRDALLDIPGSGVTIEEADLVRARVFNVNEALRQAPGVFARDEEGLGLRPNIGIRGLSPVRSSKVLLLEDGLPLSFAPYGDNASYYHPPIRRFSRIEILKGASQIRFGPNSVGGVINYVTPAAYTTPQAKLMLAGGNAGYREVDLTAGTGFLGFASLVHVNTARSDGNRDNQALKTSDIALKLERDLGAGHSLVVRATHFVEDSQVTYSGLTQAEYDADPRQNPFANDATSFERTGGSLTWNWDISDTLSLKTSAYASWFDRDWWRQSSNSTQRPNDASDPKCASMVNLNTTCGNEGRLREYNTYGVETRLSHSVVLGQVDVTSEVSLRYADERQNRLQINSDTPNGRTPGVSVNGGVREDNLRYVQAWSGYAATRVDFGRLTLSPGIRFETIDYQRVNRLNPAAVIQGADSLSEVIPGFGILYELQPRLVAYAGIHRGFAPPRVEDAINNSTGGSVELEAELSTNVELGLRGSPTPGFNFDLAWFKMDFDNQIVPASVAGGAGASLTSAGKTLHQGFEASFHGSARQMGLLERNDVFFRAALTWVRDASYQSTRFSNVAGFSNVSVTGNRLPYAPELLLTAALGYAFGQAADVQVEYVFTDKMFSDDLNTIAPTPNGQRGIIKGHGLWNATVNFNPENWKFGFFVTAKNLTDETFIVDRARGVLPGQPRLLQAGVVAKF